MNRDSVLTSRDPFTITKPNLIHIGNICGRDFQVFRTETESNATTTTAPQLKLPTYEEDDDNMINCMEIDDNFDIQTTKTGQFVLKFHVAPSFYSSIIGAKHATRRKLERDTNTSIEVPNRGNHVTVYGINERDVISAKNRIDLIILDVRDKHPFTHFLSIPMVSDMIKHNFDNFKVNSILNGSLIRGLDVSMFQNPNKLHLTIGPLVLADEIEQNDAVSALKECKEKVIRPILDSAEPLQMVLKGVEIMNDDPTNVDVLYGKVTVNPPKYHDCFQKITDGIINHFAVKGLTRKQYESVKLHVTLINSIFRKTHVQNNETRTQHKQKRESFDASTILTKYKDFNFGSVDLDFIHLSIRFTKSESSYYEALNTISLK